MTAALVVAASFTGAPVLTIGVVLTACVAVKVAVRVRAEREILT